VLASVHNGQMTAPNPEWNAMRDAIAMIRARTNAEADLMLPQISDVNDDGTVSVNPTFVPVLAALTTISRDLSRMVDAELLEQYWQRKTHSA
jgi:hypothetical protein